MNRNAWFALAALLGGLPLTAYGLAYGAVLLALVGLVLLMLFWFFVSQWLSGAGKPRRPIQPAQNAAWSMRDQPVSSVTTPTSGEGPEDKTGS